VHVFAIDSATNGLKEMKPLMSKPGYGPRHAAFWTVKIGDAGKGKIVKVFMFVIHELSNKIVSYSVKYGDAGLMFKEVDEVSTFGNKTTPEGAAAAEIVIVRIYLAYIPFS
jgi:6-phosphogluconolactonase (cycloisomerase 2 family)